MRGKGLFLHQYLSVSYNSCSEAIEKLLAEASALANPTRCFMPPASSFGYAASNPSSPTVSRTLLLRSSRCALGKPRASRGASTFCSTVNHGKSAKLWKTMDRLDARSAVPFQRTVPSVGCDGPVRIRKSVDLPDPEGPSNDTISPASIERLNGAITCIRL